MKIAMWSGPRNLSTAMMYSFGNRKDFSAWDEPFYGSYLKHTGINHPMRDTVLEHEETDPNVVAKRCNGQPPDERPNWYMKHMSFHMRPGFPLDWARSCVNVHLIRHPARVVASYAVKREKPNLEDIGFEAQVDIYEKLPGPVVNSYDIRRDPERMLRKLCDAIDLEFDDAMLNWPVGPKKFDGVWAPHWYGSVHGSTSFASAEGPLPELSGSLAQLAEKAMPFYESLRKLAI